MTFPLPSPSSDLKVPNAATCVHRFLILVSDGVLFKLNVIVLDPSRIRVHSLTNQHLSIDSLAHKCCFSQVRGAERGDIKISMQYYEGESQLIVKVLECKSLKPFPGRVSCSKYYGNT